MMKNLSIPIACLVLAAASSAHAAPLAEASASAPRQGAVDLELGMLTPVGEIGVRAWYAPSRHVSISAGAGAGLSGPQLSAMGHLHTSFDRGFDFSFGLGPSVGPYHTDNRGWGKQADTFKRWTIARWVNAELAAAYTTRRGWRGRIAFGHGWLTNEASSCTGPSCDEPINQELPSFSIGIGKAF